jgi:hypothetical protein
LGQAEKNIQKKRSEPSQAAPLRKNMKTNPSKKTVYEVLHGKDEKTKEVQIPKNPHLNLV